MEELEKEIELKEVTHKQDEESMSNSYKDEFLVFIFTLPIILVFISAMIDPETSMKGAIMSLEKLPEWYQQILFILVLVVFGLKTIVIRIADKFIGNKPNERKKEEE